MVSLRVEGLDTLAKTLNQLPERVNRSVQREALRAGGELIMARASAIAPRAPGAPDLADNIGISNARPEDGSVGIAVGPTKAFYYGFFQEFGTSRHGAQPFMRPAFDGESRKALSVVRDWLWGALASRGIGLSSSRTVRGPVSGGPGGGLL